MIVASCLSSIWKKERKKERNNQHMHEFLTAHTSNVYTQGGEVEGRGAFPKGRFFVERNYSWIGLKLQISYG